MMKLCLLFGLCLAYALAAEETKLSATCTPQLLNAHMQCEEKAIFDGLNMAMQLKKDGFECFEKNKCEVCEEEDEREGGERGSGHHGSGHTPSPAEKEEEACLKDLMESEHKSLSACVSQATNGLELPRFPGHHKKGHREERGRHSGHHSGSSEEHEEHHSGHHSGSGEWEERRKHKFERKVLKACHHNNESAKAVFECLKAIKPVFEQDKEKFCAERKTCETAIEGKCDREDEEFAEEEIRKALETCLPKTVIQELTKEVNACKAFNPEDVARKHHENKKKGEDHGKRHHSGHHSGSGSGHHPHFPHKEGEEHHSGHHSGHRESSEEHREGREHRDFCKAKPAATATSG